MTVYEGSEFKVEQRGFLNSVIITGHSRLYSGTPRGNTPEHTGCGSVRRKRQDDSGREASIRRGLLASITPTPTKRQQEEGGGGRKNAAFLHSCHPSHREASSQALASQKQSKREGFHVIPYPRSMKTVRGKRDRRQFSERSGGRVQSVATRTANVRRRPRDTNETTRNKNKNKQRNKNACRKERKDESSQKPDFPHKLSDWEVGTGGGASLG